jgi:hypothetical protein
LLYFFAQLAYVNPEVLRLGCIDWSPDFSEDVLMCEHPSFIFYKEQQQVVLSGCQMQQRACTIDRTGCRINDYLAKENSTG